MGTLNDSTITLQKTIDQEYRGDPSDNTGWDDIRIPMTSTKAEGSKAPTFTQLFDDGSGSQGVFSYVFSNSTEQELYFGLQMPHGWKSGTAIHPHTHWVSNFAGIAGDVVEWGMEYVISEIGSEFGNTNIIYGSVNNAGEGGIDDTIVADRHYLTELGTPIDMSGVDTVSAMLLGRIFRNTSGVTDTFDKSVALLEIDFHYEIDQPFGSRGEYIK